MGGSMAWMLLCTGLVAGCASHMAPLAADRTAFISGRETANLGPQEAERTVFIDAARITVDHGMQYFRIVDVAAPSGYERRSGRVPIRPGADVTIKLYPADYVSPNADGVWDAQKILTFGVPSLASAETRTTPVPVPPRRPPNSAPRCTAYGCDW